jgi:hypothetical protein
MKTKVSIYIFRLCALAWIVIWCMGCGSTPAKFDTEGTKIITPKMGLEHKMLKWGDK